MLKRKYLFAALAAVVVLAGCGESSETENSAADTQETAQSEDGGTVEEEQDSDSGSAADGTDTEDSGSAADGTDAEDSGSTADGTDTDGSGSAADEADAEDSGSTADEMDTEDDGTGDETGEGTETDTAELDPITPSDYLIADASDYVTLADYDGMEVTRYTYEITDEMVQDEIQEELAASSNEISTGEPSQEDDTVYFTMTSQVQGADSDEEEETFITLGLEEFGPEFDKQLTGVSVGDKLEFSVSYDEDIWIEDWMNQTVDFEIEVTDVTRTEMPEYNEEYVMEYTEYASMEEYEESVREYLESYYEEQSYYDAVEELLYAALEKTTFDGYPDDLYDACREESLSMYTMFVEEDAEEEDILDTFGITEEDIHSETLDLVNRRLFISAYALANNVELTEEEYVDFVTEYAQYYGEESAAAFEEAYGREAIVNALYEEKVTDLLLEQANVTETPYSDDLMFEEDMEDDLEEIDESELLEMTDEEDELTAVGSDGDFGADEEMTSISGPEE